MVNEMQFKEIHDEREALLADVENLNDAQWHTQSLCEGWTVQQVLAHLTSAASTSKMDVAKAMLKAKGNFNAAIEGGVREYSSGTPAQTLEAFRDALFNTSVPVNAEAMLGDTVVHGEDIRHPLGIKREYPIDLLRHIADFYAGQGFPTNTKKRIEGLRLVADDAEWTHGEGQVVSGPLLALIMTMTGRTAFLDDLSGDGLALYRERFTA